MQIVTSNGRKIWINAILIEGTFKQTMLADDLPGASLFFSPPFSAGQRYPASWGKNIPTFTLPPKAKDFNNIIPEHVISVYLLSNSNNKNYDFTGLVLYFFPKPKDLNSQSIISIIIEILQDFDWENYAKDMNYW